VYDVARKERVINIKRERERQTDRERERERDLTDGNNYLMWSWARRSAEPRGR